MFFRIRIQIHKFFSDSDTDSDHNTNILTHNVAFRCFRMCSGTFTTEEKFSNRKTYVFFSFKCLICDFSQKKIILQLCLDPTPYPNPDSDSAKTYGFFLIRIWIHNTSGNRYYEYVLKKQICVQAKVEYRYCKCDSAVNNYNKNLLAVFV
jgi:hypothetical protein